MSSIRAYPPLPVRPDWAPSYLSARAGAVNRDFAFRFLDPQGMPAADGRRYHGGVDWFAPAGSVISAPRAGKVIRADRSSDTTGQVFGGVLELEEASGITWVMRHVQPTVSVGTTVAAGEQVATVMPWSDGGTHLHLEIHRSAAGGYRMENALDPAEVEWSSSALMPVARPDAYFEELPARLGGTGPDIVGQARGYSSSSIAGIMATAMRLRGWLVSTLRADDGRTYIYRWAPGTHGARFRFGPWQDPDARDLEATTRTGNTGRIVRKFSGRPASLYPWPANGGEA